MQATSYAPSDMSYATGDVPSTMSYATGDSSQYKQMALNEELQPNQCRICLKIYPSAQDLQIHHQKRHVGNPDAQHQQYGGVASVSALSSTSSQQYQATGYQTGSTYGQLELKPSNYQQLNI